MPKHNAFDLLRLILASLVLISHGYLIGGFGTEPFIAFTKGQTYIAEIGVMGFFALSGYLITGSFDRQNSIVVFLWHRLLRIFPGFWVCLLITAFVIAPVIFYLTKGSLNGFSFTGTESAVSYIYKNCLLGIRQWSIKDLLTAANYKESLDGSLWTLLPEFQCYLFTLIIGTAGLISKNRHSFLIVFCLMYLVYIVNPVLNIAYGPTFIILSKAMKLYICYLAGSLLFIYRDKLRFDVRSVILFAVFFLLMLKFGGFLLGAPILIAIMCIGGFSLFNVNLKYDISFGLYIYGFPVQQLLAASFGKSLNIYLFLAVSLILSCIMGLLSCILVERQFLKFKNAFAK